MSHSRNSVIPLFALLAIGTVIRGANAKPPSRILGGELAADGQFGSTVILARPGSIINTCGGGIIGPRHILTAAHCVDKRTSYEVSVRAGINNLTDTNNVVERLVSRVIIHPDYVSYIEGQRAVENDIAILVLTNALPIGGRILTINLPTQQPDRRSYFFAGWGKNGPNPTMYQYELKTIYMAFGDPNSCPVTETFCATSDSGALCSGDSGSPLMSGGYIYGIASTSNCIIGEPARFVNVYNYLSWINEKISQYP